MNLAVEIKDAQPQPEAQALPCVTRVIRASRVGATWLSRDACALWWAGRALMAQHGVEVLHATRRFFLRKTHLSLARYRRAREELDAAGLHLYLCFTAARCGARRIEWVPVHPAFELLPGTAGDALLVPLRTFLPPPNEATRRALMSDTPRPRVHCPSRGGARTGAGRKPDSPEVRAAKAAARQAALDALPKRPPGRPRKVSPAAIGAPVPAGARPAVLAAVPAGVLPGVSAAEIPPANPSHSTPIQIQKETEECKTQTKLLRNSDLSLSRSASHEIHFKGAAEGRSTRAVPFVVAYQPLTDAMFTRAAMRGVRPCRPPEAIPTPPPPAHAGKFGGFVNPLRDAGRAEPKAPTVTKSTATPGLTTPAAAPGGTVRAPARPTRSEDWLAPAAPPAGAPAGFQHRHGPRVPPRHSTRGDIVSERHNEPDGQRRYVLRPAKPGELAELSGPATVATGPALARSAQYGLPEHPYSVAGCRAPRTPEPMQLDPQAPPDEILRALGELHQGITSWFAPDGVAYWRALPPQADLSKFKYRASMLACAAALAAAEIPPAVWALWSERFWRERVAPHVQQREAAKGVKGPKGKPPALKRPPIGWMFSAARVLKYGQWCLDESDQWAGGRLYAPEELAHVCRVWTRLRDMCAAGDIRSRADMDAAILRMLPCGWPRAMEIVKAAVAQTQKTVDKCAYNGTIWAAT